MTKKHTPGPWVVCVQDGEEKAYTVFAEHQLVSKHIEAGAWDHFVACAGASHENYEANARLIAAAPDLCAPQNSCAQATRWTTNPAAGTPQSHPALMPTRPSASWVAVQNSSRDDEKKPAHGGL